LGTSGAPIGTSQYALDLFHGPVFAGSRVTGLGGAYVAISEDVDGDLQNPAAPAVRPFFSYEHFDYWLGFGLTFPADLEHMDFFNSGSDTKLANPPSSFVFFTPAANLQWGELGVGLTVEMQQYALTSGNDSPTPAINVTIPTTHLQFGYGFGHNQLVVGAGARFLSMAVHREAEPRTPFKSSDTGLEFGAVYKPEGQPFRLGLAYRSAIRTEARYTDGLLPDANGDLVVVGSDGVPLYLPKAVALPWDVNAGLAVQFGRRPFNPAWRTRSELIEEEVLKHALRELQRKRRSEDAVRAATTEQERKEREAAFECEQREDDRELERKLTDARRRIERDLAKLNGFYLLVSASVLVSGPVNDALGVESLVTQTVKRSGLSTVVSPRIGLESEVVPAILRLRAGSYLEPARFEESTSRVHFTAGFDIRLIRWNVFGAWPDDYVWRLGVGGDAAHRYTTWGLTLAGWYPRHREDEEDHRPLTAPSGQ